MVPRQIPLVELVNVSFEGLGQTLLDQVSWALVPGQSWAVLGANGAGKTLLLRMVAGKLWPNAGGEIRRQGSRLVDLRSLARRIGWVTSKMAADIPARERALDTVVSGRFAQIGLKPVAWDHPEAWDYEDARTVLRRLDGEQLADRPFGILSQGEQQKVMLARALIIQPLAIILDEPCSSLDPGARERFLDTLQKLLQSNAVPTVVLVTHHVEEIIPGLDHVLVLHQGRVVKQGATCDVLNPETLTTIYGRTPQSLQQHGGRYWPVW